MDDQVISEMLGKYQILEEIGRGGFGTVYRAKDTVLGREVALKVLNPLLMRDVGCVERFRREAKAAARLEHPYIVPIYDTDEVKGRLFIVMRLVRGESLAQMIKRGRLSWEDTLAILQQVGAALTYAHTEGIIHRDIKPGNILLDQRMGPMLSDFGLAHLTDAAKDYYIEGTDKHILGTLPYIAPELWEGTPATPASDVYALGCVTYEMITGKLLFGGPTTPAIIKAHVHGAQLPAEWPLDTPEELTAVLTRAVTGDPTQRYDGVEAFLEALEGLQTIEVKKKRAAKVARLLAEAQDALKARRYQDAVTAAEALLALQTEHEAGQKVLEQAQAQLARHADFAAQLAAKAAQHEQESQRLEQERAALETRVKALVQAQQARDEESKRLGNEKARIETRLGELRQELQEHARQQEALQRARNALEQARTRLAQQQRQWAEATRLLEKGDWGGVEQWLTGSPGPQHQGFDSVTEEEQEDKPTKAEIAENSVETAELYEYSEDIEVKDVVSTAFWVFVIAVLAIIALAYLSG